MDRTIQRNALGFKHSELIDAGLKPAAPATERRIKTHNDADQLVSESIQTAATNWTSVAYSYSANGCLTNVAHASSLATAYTYDYNNMHGRTIDGHLIPAMTETERMTSLATIQLPEECLAPYAAACPEAEAVHISQHRRDFPWPHGKGQASDITGYRLWHRCSA